MKGLCLQTAKLEAGFELNTEWKFKQGLVQMHGDAVLLVQKKREGQLTCINYLPGSRHYAE